MPKAVLKGGVIRPIEPLPPDWREGQELRVEKVEEADVSAEEIDRDFAELAALCNAGDPPDDAKLAKALDESRRIAKEQVRRTMGLS